MASPPKKRQRTPSFRIEFSGNDEKKVEIIEKLQDMRNELTQKLNKPIGNLQVLETLLEMWSNQQEESSASKMNKLYQNHQCQVHILKLERKMLTKQYLCVLKTLSNNIQRLWKVMLDTAGKNLI